MKCENEKPYDFLPTCPKSVSHTIVLSHTIAPSAKIIEHSIRDFDCSIRVIKVKTKQKEK